MIMFGDLEIQLLVISMIVSIIISILPAICQKYRKELDIESFIWVVVASVFFSSSFVCSLRALWFISTGEYKDYNIPQDINICIVAGGILLTCFGIILYYLNIKRAYKID